jgi:hypothetical protein
MFFNIFHKILDYLKCILCCTNPIHSWRFYCICVLITVVWGMDKVPIKVLQWVPIPMGTQYPPIPMGKWVGNGYGLGRMGG